MLLDEKIQLYEKLEKYLNSVGSEIFKDKMQIQKGKPIIV